ncbi:hypothetical protein [Xenophilus azovorans]|uniref:hypothetical protein n=1 Tax=Xenophilus azovorans TaxID=151755 RepID=UPI0012EE4FED|nr:hypothetical protein [Xenophilus azovorans]
MLGIQVDHTEHLVRQGSQPHPQEVPDHRRRVEHAGTAHPPCQHALRRRQDFIGAGRPVCTLRVAHQQRGRSSSSEGVEGRDEIVRHGELQ